MRAEYTVAPPQSKHWLEPVLSPVMEMSDTSWSMLKALRATCAAADEQPSFVVIGANDFRFVAEAEAIDRASALAVFSSRPLDDAEWTAKSVADDKLYLNMAPAIEQELRVALHLYGSLCVAPLFFAERPFVITHMAQTLDGKIATAAGNSKWIGDDANLVHAHRVRALVDGVVVGGVTAQQELPSLNVRHVTGADPARIVFSDSFSETARLPVIEGMRTILIRAANGSDDDVPAGVEVIRYEGNGSGVDISGLLERLRGMGIGSILLEGGPTTLKSFLDAGAVDWLQLHISPILFGSGKDVLSLPAIEDVDEALRLRNAFYVPVGDGMMITGQV